MVMNILRSKKVTKRVLLALLILIVPAFVLWGAGNITSGPDMVGKIGGRKISTRDFEESIRGIRAQLLLSYYGDFDTLTRILQNQPIINHMAWERLILLNAARKSKIKIPDTDVMLFISLHPLFLRNDVFDKAAYNYILRNNLSMEPRVFEELMEENIQTASFRQKLLAEISVSDEEVLDSFKSRNDQVTLSYLLVDKTLFPDTPPPSEDEANQYYNSHLKDFYEIPAIDIEYMEFPYENASEKKEAEEKSSEIYKLLLEDSSVFETVAKENDIPYKLTAPFTAHDIVRGISLFKSFRNTALSLGKIGDISSPLFPGSGEKGTGYILRKIGDFPPRLKPFDEVRAEIDSILTEEKRIALAKEKAKELSDALIREDMTLEEAAASIDRKIESTNPVSSVSYIANIGPAKEIVSLTRKSPIGTIFEPIKAKDGFIITRLEKITPADEETFKKEKETLRANLLSRKQLRKMEAWFKENSSKSKLLKDLGKL